MGQPLDIKAVRIAGVDDIRRAAVALNQIVQARVSMQLALAHDVADRNTPVDEEGEILADTVFRVSSRQQEWWNRSLIALDSPLVAACRYESDPFWVNADGFRAMHPNAQLDRIDLSDFERRSMTRAAIVAPVHLPFGQIGAASLHPLDPNRTDLSAEFADFADEFSILATIFIRSYVKCTCGSREIPSWTRLTKRELECLRWVSLGKTDDEISMILARSRATIRFHLHNASMKFGAVNRGQLLFRAGLLGYINTRVRRPAPCEFKKADGEPKLAK
jgi:DNA-binding CsgD family transcriptional regulator